MKDKLKNIVNILIIIILIMNIYFSFYKSHAVSNSFSGMIGQFRTFITNEIGPKPPKSEGDPPPGGIEIDPPTQQKIVKANYEYKTGIRGNAYEETNKAYSYDYKGNIVNLKSNNPSVPNVKVEAFLDGEDDVKYTTYTDNNGNYALDNLDPGKYKLRFTYGGTDNLNTEEDIKTNLKYNGVDYTAVSYGSSTFNKSITELTIFRSGRGATEIILVLDCSVSAVHTVVDKDTGITRLEMQKKAAKELIEKLLTEKNIYFGIVCFAGPDSAYRVISQTNDKELLFDTLDEINPDITARHTTAFLSGGTNIYQGVKKAVESFVGNDAGNESNKWIILLSDGAPSGDDNEVITHDDIDEESSEEALLEKINRIIKRTRNYLISLADKSYHICSFIIESEDEIENELVGEIFNHQSIRDKITFLHSKDEDATEIIRTEILNLIKDTTTFNERVTENDEELYFDGKDDTERRKEVNNRFKHYDYKKAQLIDDLQNNYNYSRKDMAYNFLNNSYMTVTVNQKYEIDRMKKQDDNYWYMEGAGKISKEQYSDIKSSFYANQNLELRAREQLDMELDIKVTGYRLTLQNGMIYNTLSTDGTVDKNLNNGEIVKNINDIRDSVFVESIDKDLIYGSQVDIEYTIILKNVSSVPVLNATIINYLAEFTGNDLQILTYKKDAHMVTNKYTNAEYGWEIKTKEDLKDLVSDETYNNMNNGYYVTLNTANSYLLRNKIQIGANGERYIKIVLSKVLSTDTKKNNTEFTDTAEILDYTNNLGIRMRKSYKDDSNAEKKLAVISGNSIEGNAKQIVEPDYTKSMKVIVIPPTGKKLSIILISISLTLFLIAVFIFNSGKLKLRKKKDDENK